LYELFYFLTVEELSAFVVMCLGRIPARRRWRVLHPTSLTASSVYGEWWPLRLNRARRRWELWVRFNRQPWAPGCAALCN